ncbi:MAG TPA: MaoC/PaaZ C-terminal domain-containing protein [Candidatus Nanoarchaeia archaeon]|nr:MaoC/PaaZ C-terminal domain-containing protein [Candidatus Nanoarchaeia archaeon]
MKGKEFSEINVGDGASFTVKIDEKLHNAFSNVSGDKSPIHCNEKFSSKTKFEKRIGYAFLLTSFVSRLYGEYLPGGTSVCIKQDAKFVKPYFIGDELKVIGKVIGKMESTKFVEIKTEIYRNKNELIFRGNGIVQVILKNE